jgi:hypothetical protein
MSTGTRILKKNNSLKRKTRAAQIADADRNNPETNANRAFKNRAKNIAARQRQNGRESEIKRFIKERMHALMRIRMEMIDFNERGGDPAIKERLNYLYEFYSREVVRAQGELNSMPIYL